MLQTVISPPLLTDIPVIPDLEEVQEEDFVLQVASPPRWVTLGVELVIDTLQMSSAVGLAGLPGKGFHSILHTRLGHFVCTQGSRDGNSRVLLEPILPVTLNLLPSASR